MMVRWCGMYMRVSEKTKNKRDLMFTDRSLNGSKGVPAAHPSASTLCPQPTPPPPHGSWREQRLDPRQRGPERAQHPPRELRASPQCLHERTG